MIVNKNNMNSNLGKKMRKSKFFITMALIFGIGLSRGVVYGSMQLEIARNLDLIQFGVDDLYKEIKNKNQEWKDLQEIKEKTSTFLNQNRIFKDSLEKDVIKKIPLNVLLFSLSKFDNEDFIKAQFKVYYKLYLNIKNSNVLLEIVDSSLKSSLEHIVSYKSNPVEKNIFIQSSKIGAVVFSKYINNSKNLNHDVIKLVKVLADTSLEQQNGYISTITNHFGRIIYGSHNLLKQSINEQNKMTLVFNNKNVGDQFGIIYIKNDINYYVKSYYGYPYMSNSSIDDNYSSSVSMTGISGLSSNKSRNFTRKIDINFKELFAYKILENMNFAPKTDFFVNPNIKGGLYIVTEDMSKENQHFFTLASFKEEYSKFLNQKYFKDPEINKNIISKEIYIRENNKFTTISDFMINNDFIEKKLDYENFIIKLTAIDIMARSMLLGDLNENNIGFIIKNNNLEKIEDYDIALVDFRLPEMIIKENKESLPEILTVNSVIFKKELEFKIREYELELSKSQDQISKDQMLKNLRKKSDLYKKLEINKYSYLDINRSFVTANTFTKYDSKILDSFFVPGIEAHDFNIFDDSFEQKIANTINRKKYYGKLAFNLLKLSEIGSEDNFFKGVIKPAFDCVMKLISAQKEQLFTNETDNKRKIEEIKMDLTYYTNSIIFHIREIREFVNSGFVKIRDPQTIKPLKTTEKLEIMDFSFDLEDDDIE